MFQTSHFWDLVATINKLFLEGLCSQGFSGQTVQIFSYKFSEFCSLRVNKTFKRNRIEKSIIVFSQWNSNKRFKIRPIHENTPVKQCDMLFRKLGNFIVLGFYMFLSKVQSWFFAKMLQSLLRKVPNFSAFRSLKSCLGLFQMNFATF